jgi:hypothetical protein
MVFKLEIGQWFSGSGIAFAFLYLIGKRLSENDIFASRTITGTKMSEHDFNSVVGTASSGDDFDGILDN